MILSRQTRPAHGLWGLIHCEFGISLMGAISSATFVKIASGCWRKEREHRRARFPYCQNSAISLRRRAKRKNCWRKSGAANGVRETKGMRKSGSLEKGAVHPGEPDLLASRAAVRAGRNEENWFRGKKVRCIPASLISWLPWRRSRREGMRKSGSVEKEYGDSPAALASWFPGRGSEPRGMSKD